MIAVIRYNWPKYLIALLAVAAGLATPHPLVRTAAAGLAVWVAAGLAATWWVYDRSPLYRWTWATDLLPAPPERYVVLSTGLDEISATLAGRYPAGAATVVDLFDPAVSEASIRRARAHVPPASATVAGRPDRLPVPDASQDAVFAAFAAHEVRDSRQRQAVFAELARVLRPGGRLVLVEHCRDAANIAVYGPGAWHFYPRAEWLRLATGAGLARVRETTMTPLVRALVLAR
ncbi:class I SAM-dependent methyltransferase [Dactylosporangium sp. NPDC051541]|uniref:class I SAM-dependent methyltransferase n=1 Tax=Dactylosporangium sp. NPDC051541 TaxID=3363977 RepID=UPI0037AE87CA